ncbi:methyl-accepting chemotaxis protein [Flammeovirga agarivorans]|uniref:PAS domain S-box protein n=1 Tax=Flammeovirga agarivorans TaxID=2726742 RepID=A0A7X8SGG0_9BACT|nr:PAS domain S-box protein [Flammeovirga agarivorans]NLR89637.1 PAS domain S-box protein [Flammeovirga agarivorans]
MALGDNIKKDRLLSRDDASAGNGRPKKLHQDCDEIKVEVKQLKQKLKALEKTALLVETSLDGKILSCNKQFANTFGYSTSELLKEPLAKLLSPDTPQNFADSIFSIVEKGEVYTGTTKHITKEGKDVWLEVTISPIIDEHKRLEKYIMLGMDVTDLMEREERFADVQSELDSRINIFNTAALVSETDLYGTITFANETFAKLSGFTQEELIGKPHSVVRHPANPKSLFKELWDKVQNGQMFQGTYRNLAKDGSHYWVQATIAPVLGADGKPVKYIGVRFDVTKQMDQEKEMEAVQEVISESTGVLVMDLDENILEANPLITNILGYHSESELIGKSHSDLIPDEPTHQAMDRERKANLNNGKFYKNTFKRIDARGNVKWLEGTYNVVKDYEGNNNKIIVYLQDVTARRLANADNRGKVAAIDNSYMRVEFDLDRHILDCNDLFSEGVGFSKDELIGLDHINLVDEEYGKSQEYADFWNKLRNGEFDKNVYKRKVAGGREVWLQATYNPVRDQDGNIYKIVKICEDVTARRLANSDNRGKIAAIDNSYMRVEFDLNRCILDCNDLFAEGVGFSKDELIGLDHINLVEEKYGKSQEYADFWNKLRAGNFDKNVYKRKVAGGKEIWLQATYNPIKDQEGEVYKIVKICEDVTARRLANSDNRGKIAAIDNSYMRVEFDLNRCILDCNDLFAEGVGFSKDELIGLDHINLVEEKYGKSQEYADFWNKLRNGEFDKNVYKRKVAGGKEIWLQASYNPIKDQEGNVYKIVKICEDVTARRLANADNRGKIAAIDNSYMRVEFDLNRCILDCNDLFSQGVGFSKDELIGLDHINLVEESYGKSQEYADFWNKLRAGNFDKNVYKRKVAGGREVWLQATYNPVKNHEGEVYKIVKICEDVTARRLANADNRGKIAAIDNSYMRVEFDLDRHIIDCNDIFAEEVGFSKEQLIGLDHKNLVGESYGNSKEYEQFWNNLRAGNFDKNVYKRFANGGKEIWLQATYNPVRDQEGNIIKIVKIAENVTDRRLNNSENRAKIKAINEVQAVVEFDLNGNILDCNDLFETTTQYSKNELVGKHHRMLVEDSMANSIEYERFWDKLNQGVNDEGVYRRVRKDGQIMWLQATYNPIFDLNNNAYKVIKYATDITDQVETQRRAEALKNELESRVNAFNSAALMSETDLHGTITFANETFASLSGYTVDELIGKPHNIVRHPSTPKETFKELWATIQSGKVFKVKYRNKKKNGGYYWVDATIAPVLDAEGKPVKFIGIRFDITNQMEQQVEKDGIDAAISKSSGVLEFTMDGEISSANDTVLEMLGYNEGELLGNPHDTLVPVDQDATIRNKELWAKLQKGQYTVDSFKRVTKDGREIWLEGSYNPIQDYDGNYVKVVAYLQDITSRRQQNADNRGKIAAIDASYMRVEFDLKGHILDCNDIFCENTEYSKEELLGSHHSMLVERAYGESAEYKNFWEKLGRGEFDRNVYKRFTKSGKEVWLQATYNPVKDHDGNFYKVVKIAEDVTARRLSNAENRGKINAILKAQASVEFDLNGNILNCNDNFLATTGYRLEEIQGKHHSMFVESSYASSFEYKNFWEKLRQGEFDNGEYKRINKAGEEIWLQATYNPIEDAEGNIFKVVKYATDVTEFKTAYNALSDFLDELAKGNFDAKIDLGNINMDSDIGRMIDNNRSLRDNLKNFIDEINKVVHIAGDQGKLDERLAIEGAQGAWKDLSDAFNNLLESISNPILEFQDLTKNLSQGDLSKRFTGNAQGDIKQMADGLNEALDNLQTLLLEIENMSNTVASSSEQMKDKFDTMDKSTTTVVDAIQGISSGMLEQVARTDESSKLVEDILSAAEDTGNKAHVINRSAESGMESCQNGMQIVKHLVENMNAIENSAGSTSGSIEVLAKRSEEISRALTVITDIASQTNLLALNAAIEAARAGEAGRGFAVVAEEIRKLAEDSRQSAGGIEKVIQDVQKDVGLATKAIDKMEEAVQVGNEATKDASEVFKTILDSSEETLNLSKDVLEATDTQKSSIDSVVQNIEKIVVVSEDTAAGTKNVAGVADEMSGSVREMGETSDELNKVASQLKSGVSKFKLK